MIEDRARLRSAGAVRARRRGAARARAGRRASRGTGTAPSRVSVPFKWYPKEELLAQAAAWRMIDLSEIERRADRPRHRDEVSDLLRSPSEQGDVAVSPVPRDLRSLRHAVQRIRSHRSRRASARPPDRARQRRCSAESRAPLHQRAQHRRRGSRATTASPPSRCIIRRRWPAQLEPGPLRRLRPVGRPPRSEQARRPHHPRARATWIAASAWSSSATARFARSSKQLAARAGVAEPRHLHRRHRRSRSSSTLYAGALGVVFPPFDEDYGYVTLEAFLARKPVVTTTDAGGPLEFVEDDVTGLVVEPAPEAHRRRASRGSPPTARLAALAGRRGLRSRRARSRGTAWWMRLIG